MGGEKIVGGDSEGGYTPGLRSFVVLLSCERIPNVIAARWHLELEQDDVAEIQVSFLPSCRVKQRHPVEDGVVLFPRLQCVELLWVATELLDEQVAHLGRKL